VFHRGLISLCCPLLFCAFAFAAEPVKKNPYSGPEDVEEGHVMVRAFCARCHGPDGTGARGPDLTRGRLRHGDGDADIFNTIKDGVPGTDMPGLGDFPEKALWQIVAFIQSGRKGRSPEPVDGNPDRGKALFVRHNCASCHWTGNDGGRRGPDLSTASSPPSRIRAAILDPNSVTDPVYQQVVAELKDGRIVGGMRLNENSYFLQLIDDQERLITVPKEGVGIYRPKQSLMPSYRAVLTDPELKDLTAYVFALRKQK
jgi:putative heme-binding domain-containing protein